MEQNIESLEKRLAETERLLNLALKEVERLSGLSHEKREETSLRTAISKQTFDDLFGFCYDSDTGEKCVADEGRKIKNFYNLKNNLLMSLGYHYPTKNSKSGLYNAKVLPERDIPQGDFQDLRKLMADITTMMYDFKHREKQ